VVTIDQLRRTLSHTTCWRLHQMISRITRTLRSRRRRRLLRPKNDPHMMVTRHLGNPHTVLKRLHHRRLLPLMTRTRRAFHKHFLSRKVGLVLSQKYCSSLPKGEKQSTTKVNSALYPPRVNQVSPAYLAGVEVKHGA